MDRGQSTGTRPCDVRVGGHGRGRPSHDHVLRPADARHAPTRGRVRACLRRSRSMAVGWWTTQHVRNGNHALQQHQGLLVIGAVLERAEWVALAVERMTAMLTTSTTSRASMRRARPVPPDQLQVVEPRQATRGDRPGNGAGRVPQDRTRALGDGSCDASRRHLRADRRHGGVLAQGDSASGRGVRLLGRTRRARHPQSGSRRTPPVTSSDAAGGATSDARSPSTHSIR